jgi:hypothetical protein
MYNIHLGSEEQEEYVIEMSLADDDLENLFEEPEKKLEAMANSEPIKSHMAYNESAKPSFGSPEPLKTLDQIMEEKATSEGEEAPDPLSSDTGYDASLKELAKKREEKKQMLGEKDAQKKEITQNLAKRRTSVSYSLVNRSNFRLPPPIYTCIEGGKVVINIEVDGQGNVTAAGFNSHSSRTSNGCLVDNAIAYAYRAKFNASDRPSQKGTITYLFQSK